MNLKGKHVLVYGSGISGLGAFRLLREIGAVPCLYDQNTELDAQALAARVGEPDASRILLGELTPEMIGALDLVVMSPGVPCDIPPVQALRAAGVPLWSEIELAWQAGRGRVLAITGTNGKTTTTALLGEIMAAHYPEVCVVGNIGAPYTDAALGQTDSTWTVAEISSFQLETIDTFHPVASAITNITEDHLNRHHTMEEYIRVKELITKNQGPEDLCVLNYEDAALRAFGDAAPCRVCWFSSAQVLSDGWYLRDGAICFAENGAETVLMRTDEMKLLGLHNYENVMVAAAMARHAGVPLPVIRAVTADFAGVAHRIEYVGERNGVACYNDSKATNPEAAIKGIRAMNRPTVLIGGGYDKDSDYAPWIRSFDGKVKRLVLIGQTKEKIAEAARACGYPADQITLCEDLDAAMRVCLDCAVPGDAILLSPACASWGQFDNYEQRGDRFRAIAMGE